jgi:hypothetical protein
VAGYHIYRAATAAGPFSRINAELVTDTVYDDLDVGVGVLSGAGAGASAYYVVSSVDSAGTESVYSLAVEPAAENPQDPEAEPDAASGSGGGNALSGCFISTSTDSPPLKGWEWVVILAGALCVWYTVQGARHRAKSIGQRANSS